jgi:hypothetical protein
MKENQKIMASKISGSRKLKKSSLPKFEADVYSNIPSGELLVFSVYYLIERKIEISLENIVFVCFLLFPRKFSLKKYPRWPDSALVGRRWSNARRKKYIVANADFEYRLTTKGLRLLKQVAKKLGVVTPKPEVKIRSARVKKIPSAPVKQIEIPEIKVLPVKLEKKVQPVQEEKIILPEPIKKVRAVRAKKISPAPVKQIEIPEIKVLPVKLEKKVQPVQEEKLTPPAPIKKVRAVRVKKIPSAPVKQIEIPEIKVLPIKLEKKVQPIQEVKVEKAQVEPVSKEVKERAGKFTRMMERSDAYIHYKKNGNNSKISDFDFRSLLLCTMESSAETLARNVELFKGYAGIHHRQDLIAFLNYCEDRFSYLLKPQTKLLRKVKK